MIWTAKPLIAISFILHIGFHQVISVIDFHSFYAVQSIDVIWICINSYETWVALENSEINHAQDIETVESCSFTVYFCAMTLDQCERSEWFEKLRLGDYTIKVAITTDHHCCPGLCHSDNSGGKQNILWNKKLFPFRRGRFPLLPFRVF